MKRWWIWLLAVLVLFGAGFAGFRYYDVPSFARYAPVLAAMVDHRVTVDDAGRVDLSKQFPGITGQNNAFITWRDDGSFMAMFPTYYGRGQEVAGVMYTSRPLVNSDLHSSALHFEPRLVSVGSYEHLLLEKRINEHWYHVSYVLH